MFVAMQYCFDLNQTVYAVLLTRNAMKQHFLLFLLLGFPGIAHAYIDPGTGSLLLQGIIAAFVSVLVFWRNLRMSILNFFRDKKQDEIQTPSQSDESADPKDFDFKK